MFSYFASYVYIQEINSSDFSASVTCKLELKCKREQRDISQNTKDNKLTSIIRAAETYKNKL